MRSFCRQQTPFFSHSTRQSSVFLFYQVSMLFWTICFFYRLLFNKTNHFVFQPKIIASKRFPGIILQPILHLMPLTNFSKNINTNWILKPAHFNIFESISIKINTVSSCQCTVYRHIWMKCVENSQSNGIQWKWHINTMWTIDDDRYLEHSISMSN